MGGSRRGRPARSQRGPTAPSRRSAMAQSRCWAPSGQTRWKRTRHAWSRRCNCSNGTSNWPASAAAGATSSAANRCSSALLGPLGSVSPPCWARCAGSGAAPAPCGPAASRPPTTRACRSRCSNWPASWCGRRSPGPNRRWRSGATGCSAGSARAWICCAAGYRNSMPRLPRWTAARSGPRPAGSARQQVWSPQRSSENCSPASPPGQWWWNSPRPSSAAAQPRALHSTRWPTQA